MDGSEVEDHMTLLVTQYKQLVFPTTPSSSLSLQVGPNGNEDDSRQDDRVREVASGEEDSMDDTVIERERNASSPPSSKPCMLLLEVKEEENKVKLAPRFHRAHLNELRSNRNKFQLSFYDQIIMSPDGAARTMSYDEPSSFFSEDDDEADNSSPRGVESHAKDFFRFSNCPSIPSLATPPATTAQAATGTGSNNDSGMLDAGSATLHRCYAWSQDSIDQQQEQRSKRRWEEPLVNHSLEGVLPPTAHRILSSTATLMPRNAKRECLLHNIDDSTRSTTFIHWEEQVADSEGILNVMHRALEVCHVKEQQD